VQRERLHERVRLGPVRRGAQPPPVFLVGPARSGTTLIYKLLCLHPEAAWISNWLARFPDAPAMAALNRLPARAPHARRRVWFGGDGANAYVYGRPRELRDRLFPMPHEGEPVYARCGIATTVDAAHARSGRQAAAFRDAVAAVRLASGAPVFVNKRIANNRRIPLLQRAFPDARFISLVRDGRAVALSLSKVNWWPDSHVWWYGGTPRQWEAGGGTPWEICARNWVEELRVVEEGLAGVAPERVLSLSYESFLDAPVQTLQHLADFSGLAPSRSWDRSVRSLEFPDRNEAWRALLDDDAVRAMTEVQSRELRKYGYGLER
jgi:omega-hydroxy-beta-dihydromenaquinone-9 sulfotransferase